MQFCDEGVCVLHAFNLSTVGHVLFNHSAGTDGDWQNDGVPSFQAYMDKIVPRHHSWLSRGASCVSSADHRKLNEEMVRLGSTPCIGDLEGGLGAVTSVDARIKFPMFPDGCGQFAVGHGQGATRLFLAVPTPMAQIFETKGEFARESITVIYTDDGGQLWLMPWSPDVDDLDLLGKAQWVLSRLAEATIKAAVQGSDGAAGYGGKSGANPLWKAVVFPVPSGTVWRKVDWLAGANLKGVDGSNIVTVHQKFSIEFDMDKVPFVEPPRVDDLLGKQVKVLNRPFVIAKVMPSPSLEVSPYPFRVDWMVHVTMPDWALV